MPFGREQLVCDCVFTSAPLDEATQAAIDSDTFEVISTEVEIPDDCLPDDRQSRRHNHDE